MKHIVKRNGTIEAYDVRKLYASVYAACLGVHETTKSAEIIAEHVANDIGAWLTPKTEVTSKDIRKAAGSYLIKINPHAGYLYLHHRILW